MNKRSDYPVYQLLEKRGNFFCPAKWTELYLYLNHGNSNSCHHPLPHKIPREMLSNPSVLHNTPHKLAQQSLMITDQRPEECHMCWHVEDLGETAISDRIHKSIIWSNDINALTVDPNHTPKLIEVVFDNICNLMCSYCDSGQSSTWANKITNNPMFFKTDYRKLYYKQSIDPAVDNTVYFDAWMRWWPDIKDKVEYLKLSGGEPLLSKNCWQFLEALTYTPQLSLAINSNLSYNSSILAKFCDKVKNFKLVIVSASIDATGDIAEYSRQGLDYSNFIKNIDYWCTSTPEHCTINLQSTVNIFNIWGITDMFDLSIKLKQQYPNKVNDFYSTIVRFPEFQTISILPDNLKHDLANNIQVWLDHNTEKLSEIENNYVRKIILYLNSTPELLRNLPKKNLISDLIKFIDYYDKSSKKKFKEVYPSEFVEWVNQCR
jgi:organic radical activating enzyme